MQRLQGDVCKSLDPSSASSLKCWSCTTDPLYCDDPFSGNFSSLEECKLPSYQSLRHPSRAVCMKMRILPKGSTETITQRSCRWEHSGTPKDSCKHEQSSNDYKVEFCETCDNEYGCNGGFNLDSWSILIFSTAVANIMRTKF